MNDAVTSIITAAHLTPEPAPVEENTEVPDDLIILHLRHLCLEIDDVESTGLNTEVLSTKEKRLKLAKLMKSNPRTPPTVSGNLTAKTIFVNRMLHGGMLVCVALYGATSLAYHQNTSKIQRNCS